MVRKKSKRLDLQWKILIGIVTGIILGLLLNQTYGPGVQSGPIFYLKLIFTYGGDIFIRLLRMLIVPLVFASIFMSIVNLGDMRKLKKMGLRTILYYFVTTALAVLLGMFLVNLIHPGKGIEKEAIEKLNIESSIPEQVSTQGVGERSPVIIITETLIDMIPKNPAAAMAKADILQIIFFAVFLAIVTAMVGKDSDSLIGVIDGLDKVMNRAIMLIMEIAPYCIFFLVTTIVMDMGFSVLGALGKYALTVLLGLAIHASITLPILVIIFGRYNPFRLAKAVLPAILTAWSTASSIAALPLTMECMEKRVGVNQKVGHFVLPLGATVNMDGTALYESVAVIFIAELLGYHLTFGTQLIIFITATLAAIGAAAIPGAGLVTMGIVLTAAGVPLEGIGLILAIDRILDQFRTAVNVWGDSTAALVVGRLEGAINDDQTLVITDP